MPVQFRVSDGSFVRRVPYFSRRGAKLTRAQRLDYSAVNMGWRNLVGLGEALEEVIHSAKTANQKQGVPDYSTGSLVGEVWRVTVPPVDMTAEEITARLAEVKTTKKEAAAAEFRRRAYGGASVEISAGVFRTIQTDALAVTELERGKARMTRLSLSSMEVVTQAGDRITLTPAMADTLLVAIETHVAACQDREVAIHTALDNATTVADAEAVNETTGWP